MDDLQPGMCLASESDYNPCIVLEKRCDTVTVAEINEQRRRIWVMTYDSGEIERFDYRLAHITTKP